jgi:hypothetical protein
MHASIQLTSFTVDLPLSRVKAFDLTAEVRVVCVVNETHKGDEGDALSEKDLYQRSSRNVSKSFDDRLKQILWPHCLI